MRVVLAHSCPERRRRFARLLSGLGHDVDEASTADDAVAACLKAPPDVAVVDTALCPDDRCEVLLALKRDAEAYRSAVVLVERADLGLEAAQTALRAGVQDFLVEPVSDAELVARV